VLYKKYAADIMAAAKRADAESRVLLAGAIGEDEKAYLYQNCAAFLMPSRREGFGMPVIEAFHCGKPVFCARQTALPEVGGDCAFYWDDLTPPAMAALVSEKMASPDLNSESEISRRKQRAARFSWDANVRAYLDLYAEVLDGKSTKQRTQPTTAAQA
jgi:glycosyltransferase involved in cell wall biosynthesis